ncbi:MAG: AAA family ATPase, partial [Ruminococcus sp.]|nr:AAA family ATPase [Ruminococcus sp.]
MAKSRYIYTCNQCDYKSSKWNGKCPSCNAWNSFEEEISVPSATSGRSSSKSAPDLSEQILELEQIGVDNDVRYDTGIGELNRVLGGGLVKGSLVLLGGEPGIGKSTILLQICQFLGNEHSVLYVSGEESARQIKLRAKRLGVDTENLYILTSTDAEAIAETISSCTPDIAIIDSIQTVSINRITSSPGSITQVRECTNLFMHTAKNQEIPIIIVGHVNKDGAIAGPKVMEHIVDAGLYFEGERHQSYRLLRAVKN